MELSALAGNDRIKERLSRREKSLSHAYIISGPAGSGRHTLARLMAAAMLCTSRGEKPCGVCSACVKAAKGLHPDVSVIAGVAEGKPITVDQVRSLRADAYIRPNEGERKIYLLEGADQMNASAQNAMLKLLEEGPPYAAFLLIAGSAGGLLQTVRSRCEELALTPDSRAEETAVSEEIRDAAKKLAGALERAGELELLEAAMLLDAKRSREELSALLNTLEGELGIRAVRAADRRRLLRAVELVKKLRGAARLNVSGGQLSGWLCAGMGPSPGGHSFS